MKVKFHKIEITMSTPTRLFELPAVRYDCDVSFSTSVVAGDAFLRIYEISGPGYSREVILNRDIEMQLIVDG